MSGMHLVRGMTSINLKSNKNKKRKLSLSKIAKYEQEMREYNKRMKRIHAPDLQMDLQQYIDYCYGVYKPPVRKQETKTYEQPEAFRRTTEKYPSLQTSDTISGPCTKIEPKKYTGTLIKGIATMHKSNAVPIIDKDQAIEISNMRRG